MIADWPPLLLFQCPRQLTLGKETRPDISCEWNTKFSIISEIPSKGVHSKRIPKFSKTFPGIFTFPFSFGPEISKFVVEWKAPVDFRFRVVRKRFETELFENGDVTVIQWFPCLSFNQTRIQNKR